ncbi:outer membrane lipoprotein carrier protein LolA [Aliiroseovarius subalbicans]|nr:outer membrane lipoprotein carrier protein LolA [Aliiroseovarius subalbicans]MCI2400194.1 outer membrane lipoprotein carrier protein LolA [Aliiroseovarius subalbicans]
MFRVTMAAAALALTAWPAAADKLTLGQISNYLNGLKTAEAEFTQINNDGTISTGRILIKRPGKARFEYNPPVEALVIAGSQQVAIFDGKSNTGPTQYPLKRTPLNLILARNIDLNTARMVVGHEYDGTATSVIAQDPEHPEYGTIKLMFSAAPVELRQWIITDNAGEQTTVILGEMSKGASLANSLFSITGEKNRRNN